MKKTTRKIGIRPTPFDSLQTHLKVNMWAVGIKSKQQKEHGFDHKQHLPSFFEKKKGIAELQDCQSYQHHQFLAIIELNQDTH